MIFAPRAVIDIGSNAIRLVVYGGPPRAPMPIYNEKARIALGESVASQGSIEPKVMKQAIAALVRFVSLTKAMKVEQCRIVATEATRRASNNAEFIADAGKAGVAFEILSGEIEARASALGVVCDVPWATGYVADLGGGSLELARLVDGEPMQPVSMPFGTIPISAIADCSPRMLAEEVEKQLGGDTDFKIVKGLPLHLVGGAWRALGQLHMQLTKYPITILSNYTMPTDATLVLAPAVASPEVMEASGVVPSGRIPFMPAALLAINALVRILEPSELVISVYGLREGLLFDRLSKDARSEDPLIAAARHEGARLSRFAYHGDRIADWITSIFESDDRSMERLRYAACLLADCAWNSNPDYRADHAAALALEGNWPGVTATDRAIIAAALYAAYGGKRSRPPVLSQLATPEQLDKAQLWGLAIRLAQRLDGGTGHSLSGIALVRRDDQIKLEYSASFKHLEAQTVKRRLKHLAEAFAAAQSV